MSRLSLAAVVALVALALPATAWSFKLEKPERTDAGTITFTGALDFSSLTTEIEDVDGDSDVTLFGVGLGVGYLVMNSLEIGGNLGVGTASGDDDSSTLGFNIGAFAAFYAQWLKGNALFPYAQLSVDYNSTSTENEIGEETVETTTSGPTIRGAAGIMLAIGGRTGGFMKVDIGYEYYSWTIESDADGAEDIEGTTSGPSAMLGFGLYIH